MSINSPDAVIAVFELEPYWGPELQRQFHSANVAVAECRSFDDIFPIVDGFSKAIIVIDLDTSIADCLAWLGTEVAKHPIQIRKLDDQAIFKSWIRPSAFLKFEREIESSILNPPRDERRPSEPVRCC